MAKALRCFLVFVVESEILRLSYFIGGVAGIC